MPRLRFAMVCAANVNRSMMSHALLKESGFYVSSYGTASKVKLPGPSVSEPTIFPFGTPYKHMYQELERRNAALYTRNGCLEMLRRNAGVKLAPEKWQKNAADGYFDIVMTFEEKVFDAVTEDMHLRGHEHLRSVLVVNLDIKDSHEEAASAAPMILNLSQMLEAVECWEDEVDFVMQEFERKHKKQPIYTICFY